MLVMRPLYSTPIKISQIGKNNSKPGWLTYIIYQRLIKWKNKNNVYNVITFFKRSMDRMTSGKRYGRLYTELLVVVILENRMTGTYA